AGGHGAGMRILADHIDLPAAIALHTVNDADNIARGFELDPLLDMALEKGGKRRAKLPAPSFGYGGFEIANAIDQRHAIGILLPDHLLDLDGARIDGRAHAGRQESRALFIVPDG